MRKTVKKWFWPTLLVLQCTVLLVLTWIRPAALMLDNDAAKFLTHVVEMWKNGSALIPGWRYQTSLELDTPALVLLPIYGLTGDILLSCRLADTLLTLATAALLLFLLHCLGQSRDICCLGTLLVLLPYGFGQLEYWNMMFIGSAYYLLKTLLPLVLICLMLPVKGRRPWGYWAGAAATVAFVALTAFSSGAHMLLCGVFPVLAWRIWLWWAQKQTPDRFTVSFWLGTLAAAGGGMLLGRVAGVYNLGDSTVLAAATDLSDNVLNCLTGIFSLFGAVSWAETPALSLQGISQLLRVLFVLCLLAALAAAALAASRGEQNGQGYLAAVALWNLLILCITRTSYGQYFEYRYHLIDMVPVLLLFAMALPKLRGSVRTPVLLGVLALVALADLCAARATAPAVLDDPGHRDAATAVHLIEAVDALDTDVPVVYIEYYTGITEMCRMLDPGRRYVTYDVNEDSLVTFDYYWTDMDAATWNGPCLYALYSGRGVPAGAQPVGEGAGFTLYYAPTNTADGVAGFVAGERMVDYPNSPAYTFDGTLDEQRRLHAVGTAAVPFVVRSPTLTFYTQTDVTLDYTAEGGTPGQLELWVEEQKLFTAPLDGSAPQVSLSGITPGKYILKVSLPEGSAATLGSITFTPSGQ